jgi:Domain of unknown function (DUF3387)
LAPGRRLAKEETAPDRPESAQEDADDVPFASTDRTLWKKSTSSPIVRAIARELTSSVRANVTIDWTIRDNVRAQLRVIVKRILRKHGYPPDRHERATRGVLEQAEVQSETWASA